MDGLQIEVTGEGRRSRHQGKGRVFQAGLLGYMECPWLWPQAGDTERPVWACYACSEAQVRPFTANLQCGNKAVTLKGGDLTDEGTKFEFLRSAGYVWGLQRFEDFAVTTAYLPEFFHLDPGMVDPTGIKFIAAPSLEWLAANATKVPDPKSLIPHVRKAHKGRVSQKGGKAATDEGYLKILAHAPLFSAYLDRRTRAPLIPDPRFHAQLLVACVEAGMAGLAATQKRSWSDEHAWGEKSASAFKALGMAEAGMALPLAMGAKHEPFQKLLAAEVAAYFKAI